MDCFAHETNQCTLPGWFVRQLCEQQAGVLDKGTYSRWCGRFDLSSRRDERIPIEIASSLVSFAVLHSLDARRLDGDGYKKIYPLVHREMIQVYGRRTNSGDEWRYANPATEAG